MVFTALEVFSDLPVRQLGVTNEGHCNRRLFRHCLFVRTLSAIVLLFWAVCYGRCLAQQYGSAEPTGQEQQLCAQSCCQLEKTELPAPAPPAPCGLCDFIKSGGALPGNSAVLDVPVFFWFPTPESDWLTASRVLKIEPTKEVQSTDCGHLHVPRMCEWMASTAAPVRGPNCCA